MFKTNKMKIRAALLVLAAMAMVLPGLFVPSPVFSATAPSLGAAASYSVLAGSIVTNTGPTAMPGDLGISPGIGATPHYSGFPPGIVGPPGTIHDADGNAATAQAANTAAFGFLDQLPTVTYPGVKDLVGLSLVPGVYAADAFELSGTLTLVGSGVWIFKSSATLITSGTAKVIGGDPCSVWWRVVSSATLGTNTQLTGNILALTSISLQTGAALNGRALAQTGAVTLDSNVITSTPCGGHLSLTKMVSPASFTNGTLLTYTLVATNDGDTTLTDVSIIDPEINISGPQPATLAPGDTLTVTGNYTAILGDVSNGSFTNTATASDTLNTVSANASATAFAQLDVPHLALIKTVSPPTFVVVGEVLTYTLIATNDGDTSLDNVSISDPDFTLTGPQPATLGLGATLTVTGNHTITQADLDNGSVSNNATATGTPEEGTVSANASAVANALQIPHLSLTKIVNPNRFSQVGDVLTFTLVATNDGNITLTNVSINDTLLDNILPTYPQAATLAPGAALTVTGTHTITQGDLNSGFFNNTATASGSSGTSAAASLETLRATSVGGEVSGINKADVLAPWLGLGLVLVLGGGVLTVLLLRRRTSR